MERKRSILNIAVSVSFQIITMVMGILIKRLLIQYCGNAVNGLNALYLSIIGILAVAELGIGNAITFGMYRPIVDGDEYQVSALYHLFDRLYKLIGGVVFLCGIGIIPFLPKFASGYVGLRVSLPITFFVMLLSSVLTYLFGAKTALINAYKNNYISTAINSSGIIIQYILQALVLYYTKSFTCFLACRIVAVCIQWIATDLVAKRKYASIMYVKANLNHEIRRELVKNIRAMFMHKIGTLLVNTVDSVVISTFIGVAVLGKYSNYIAILAAMNSVIVLIFSSLTSVVGHMYVASDKHTMQKYCETFHLINFCVAIVFYTGYYAIVDGLVSVLFSTELVMDRLIVAVISLNGYVQFMRTSVHMFREATGTFYNDRWKPLAEGIVNIVLSIYLVKKYGITGVIIATIITNLLICHVVEPYVLYKNAFSRFPIKHYLRNYAMIFVYLLAQSLMDSVRYEHDNPLVELLVNGFISVGISLTTCGVVLMMSKELRKYMSVVVKKFSKSGKRGSNSI